jgi:TIR domain-containing protein
MGKDHEHEDDSAGTAKVSSDAHVFICYNTADQRDAEALARMLLATGLDVWIDLWKITAGPIIPQLEKAINQASMAVVIIGRHGVGRWQNREYEAILRQRLDSQESLRIVPVLLPGAKEDGIPMLLRDFALHRLSQALNSQKDVKRLYELLTGRSWPHGAYEIHIEVQDAAVTCFAAVPNGGSKGISSAIQEAVNMANSQLGTDIVFQCGASAPVDRYREIHASEVVVADCRPVEPNGNPDPMVLYQLGAAQSIGKPVIIIASRKDFPNTVFPTPHVVYCSDGERCDPSALKEELAEHIKDLAGYAILGLVADDSVDITAAYSDMSQPRPMLFRELQAVLRAGLRIHKCSREIAKDVHRFVEMIESLQTDLHDATRALPPEKAIATVREAFQRKVGRGLGKFGASSGQGDVEYDIEELRSFSIPHETDTWTSFAYLEQKTTGDAQKCVTAAERDLEETGTKIAHFSDLMEGFLKAFEDASRCLEKGRDPSRPFHVLADQSQNLERAARSIDESTTDMMTDLLEMIGRKDLPRPPVLVNR